MNRKKNIRIAVVVLIGLTVLSSFFIYTMEHAEPASVGIDDGKGKKHELVLNENTLQLLLLPNNRILYFTGVKAEDAKLTSPGELDSIIKAKKAEIGAEKIAVVIKKSSGASQKNIEAVLDEMTKQDIANYIVQDVKDENIKVISN